ncbi:MAG: sodium:glutamate symporter, partial [Candidatus Methanomethylophilaceae archaeon]|nr:sodium:glutamate symporter [Candidatus Methanomethylophilaceae archaeon]
LSLFLSMALMSMKLWQLADLAAVMIITLLIQTVVLSLFVYHFVFKLTGANYDSATLVSGTMGFGMGATPNAVANVEAIIEAHGPAPVAYFLVPLIGGVFMDLLNVSVLTVLLNIL